MAKKVLIIDHPAQGSFFLSVEGGALTVGDNPIRAASLRDLRISRIRCEVEVEGEVEVAEPGPAGGPPVHKPLRPGEDVKVGGTHLRLAYPQDEEVVDAVADEGADAERPRKVLRVIDGADMERVFPLPESGYVSIGKSGKHADFVLHDLYVSGVHCSLEVSGDRVVVSHVEGPSGTRINGQTITGPQELKLHDILRVGNSHMRLELGGESETETEEAAAEEPGGREALADEAASAREAAAADEAVVGPVAQAAQQVAQLQKQPLGRYQLGPLLGRGHSGLVFRAQDVKNNLVVAIKVLSPEFPADPAELQHFAQALAGMNQLQHPNLVTLYGAGKTGAHCWIAREYVEGESAARLMQRAREGKLGWGAAAAVAVHLAKALAFLHGHKVVHANLTPRNILVRAADKVVKLADLRLARAIEGSRLQKSVLERKLLAELPYLAPEQVEPDAFVDHLADLYALGAVFYALLAGRPPFGGASPEETIAQIRAGKPPRPSKFQRGIPPAVEGVALKLLARNQEDRYPTAAALLSDIEPLAASAG